MGPNNITVEPLEPARYAEVGALLARAFEHDPLYAYVLPDAATRLAKLAWMFERWLHAVAPSGMADITSGGEGVALWLPPGHRSSVGLWGQIRTGLLWAPFQIGARNLPRALRVAADMKNRIQELEYPYWELNTLGVDPAAQRSGIGALLIRHGLERAARDRAPCYVITHNAANIAYYERFGFNVTQQRPREENGFFACTLRRDAPVKNQG